MQDLKLSIGEPFTSPAWGSNFVMFTGESGQPIAAAETKEYLRRCCKYAKHYGVCLVPERFVLLDYQCMCLISAGGKVVGAQRALFTNPAGSRRGGGKKGGGLEVFYTEYGCVALVVDVDIYRPAVARIAAAMGAQFLFCSQQIARGDYSSHLVLSGAWNAAQLAGVYAVSATNQFNAVSAPLPLTPLEDGFVVPPNRKLPLTATLRADDLARIPSPQPLSRKFYALHRNELVGEMA